MHAAIGALVAAATSTPEPTGLPDPNLVTPGPFGFVAIGVIAVAVIVLIWDMMRRIRRGRYRAEIREELDAEEKADEQARRAVAASDVDDQDVQDHDEEPRDPR